MKLKDRPLGEGRVGRSGASGKSENLTRREHPLKWKIWVARLYRDANTLPTVGNEPHENHHEKELEDNSYEGRHGPLQTKIPE